MESPAVQLPGEIQAKGAGGWAGGGKHKRPGGVEARAGAAPLCSECPRGHTSFLQFTCPEAGMPVGGWEPGLFQKRAGEGRVRPRAAGTLAPRETPRPSRRGAPGGDWLRGSGEAPPAPRRLRLAMGVDVFLGG